METHRYITRYYGKKGTPNTFCGWRLCMTRQKETFVRYFTDREHGSADKALAAALQMRDVMLGELDAGADFVALAARFRKGAA